MKPLKKKPPLEKAIEKAIRKALADLGWSTWKTHGSRFQAGLPDLFCAHVEHGVRWIEVKRSAKHTPTPAQVHQFQRFAAAGVPVHILHDRSMTGLLDGPANWTDYLSKAQRKALDL